MPVKKRRRRVFGLSVTMLKSFINWCERSVYYDLTIPKKEQKTSLPILFGLGQHKFYEILHRAARASGSAPRPYFYKSKKSAIASWIRQWRRAVEEHRGRIITYSQARADEYLQKGIYCLSGYWEANYDLCVPAERLEEKFSYDLRPNMQLRGRTDQIRPVTTDYIAAHRPELLRTGRLDPGYDPVIIVDLKTDYLSYDYRRFQELPTLEEIIRLQYELHEELQATAYTFLYEKKYGRKPIGFVWYHLRSGRWFFTWREETHYPELFNALRHVLVNLSYRSFPKRPDRKRCRTCIHFEACAVKRAPMVTEAEEIGGRPVPPAVYPAAAEKDLPRQLRLKIPLERVKADIIPPGPTEMKRRLMLPDLPWDSLDETSFLDF